MFSKKLLYLRTILKSEDQTHELVNKTSDLNIQNKSHWSLLSFILLQFVSHMEIWSRVLIHTWRWNQPVRDIKTSRVRLMQSLDQDTENIWLVDVQKRSAGTYLQQHIQERELFWVWCIKMMRREKKKKQRRAVLSWHSLITPPTPTPQFTTVDAGA